MIRAVLDTNVLASAIVGEALRSSTPGQLFRYWRSQAYELILSHHILDELERTLTKRYFRDRLSPDHIARALHALRTYGYLTVLSETAAGEATHPEDDAVIATAVSGRADYLATGDRHLQALSQFRNITVVSPRAFLLVLHELHES